MGRVGIFLCYIIYMGMAKGFAISFHKKNVFCIILTTVSVVIFLYRCFLWGFADGRFFLHLQHPIRFQYRFPLVGIRDNLCRKHLSLTFNSILALMKKLISWVFLSLTSNLTSAYESSAAHSHSLTVPKSLSPTNR